MLYQKQQLHEHGCAAEEPDVEPARAGDERVRRQPHDGEQRRRARPRSPSRSRSARASRASPSRMRSVEQVMRRRRPTRSGGFVTTEWTSATATTSTIAAATQRPGWRTGTARISSGRPVCLGDLVTRAPTTAQLIAPLIFGFVIAPDWIPHFSRIFTYVPLAISCFERGEDRLCHAARLRDRQAVGRELVALADQLEAGRWTA